SLAALRLAKVRSASGGLRNSMVAPLARAQDCHSSNRANALESIRSTSRNSTTPGNRAPRRHDRLCWWQSVTSLAVRCPCSRNTSGAVSGSFVMDYFLKSQLARFQSGQHPVETITPDFLTDLVTESGHIGNTLDDHVEHQP